MSEMPTSNVEYPRTLMQFEVTIANPTLEAVSILTNIPLVDLSIDYDTHIIRGEN